MGYSSDDFFEDVVAKATCIEDITSLSADNRGLPKFMRHLVTLYGGGDFLQGVCYLLEEDAYYLMVWDGSKTTILGDLQEGWKVSRESGTD